MPTLEAVYAVPTLEAQGCERRLRPRLVSVRLPSALQRVRASKLMPVEVDLLTTALLSRFSDAGTKGATLYLNRVSELRTVEVDMLTTGCAMWRGAWLHQLVRGVRVPSAYHERASELMTVSTELVK